MRSHPWRWVGAALLAATLSACGGASSGTSATASTTPSGPVSSATSGSATPSTSESGAVSFDPASVSQLFVPSTRPAAGAEPAPIVVLVPGGGWNSHDNTGLVPLAQQLADAGAVVVNTSYRAGMEGIGFPVPAQDVQCAIAYAARAAADAGVGGGQVVVVGHSAGGHLGALAAVSGTALKAQCDDPAPKIAAFVGLGGVYDTAAFEPYMSSFFGVPRLEDPARWASGDPIAYVADGKAPKRLRVLLIAGEQDFDVPVTQAKAFEAALRKAGVPVTLDVVPGADHSALFTPDVALAPILALLAKLGG